MGDEKKVFVVVDVFSEVFNVDNLLKGDLSA